jgi:hypothetical protein
MGTDCSVWEDLDTLVFDPRELREAAEATRDVLDSETVALGTPTLVVADDLEAMYEADADLWMAELPRATRTLLERARRPAHAWPHGPRIAFAVARPSLS